MYHPFSFLCLTGHSSHLCISFIYTILISFMCTSTILSYTTSHSFPLHTHCLLYHFYQSQYHISSCIMIIMPFQNVHASLNAILFSHSCHAINQVWSILSTYTHSYNSAYFYSSRKLMQCLRKTMENRIEYLSFGLNTNLFSTLGSMSLLFFLDSLLFRLNLKKTQEYILDHLLHKINAYNLWRNHL